jgi:hypothetical protein
MARDLRLQQAALQRALVESGHLARAGTLVAAGSRRALEASLREGSLVRVGHGLYARAELADLEPRVSALQAVAGYRTAAISHGWPVLFTPRRPEVIVRRGRRLSTERQNAFAVHWRNLEEEDVDDWRTGPLRTVLDCAAALPFREALAIADSALRSGAVTREEMMGGLEGVPHRGRRLAAAVVEAADGRAANPFESDLRALCLGVPGLEVEPQVVIRAEADGRFIGRVDLADRRRRLVVEAESFEFHGEDRAHLERDCRRYSELGADAWTVLRYAYHPLTRRESWIEASLRRAAANRSATVRPHARGE